MKIKLTTLLLLFLCSSCALTGSKYVDKSADKMEAGAPDNELFYDQDKSAHDQKAMEESSGSLWANTYSSRLFDNMYRASRVGDTITIVVDEIAKGSNKGDTKADRKTEQDASVANLGGVMAKLSDLIAGFSPTNLLKADNESKFQGKGSTERQGSLNARITATISRVLNNGNMVIKGRQAIKINNEEQILIVEGIIRPYDIQPDNTVDSSSLANARISYSGFGIVAEKQHPGWLVRVLDYVWPF